MRNKFIGINSPIVNQKLAIIHEMDYLRDRLAVLENEKYPTANEQATIDNMRKDLDEMRVAYSKIAARH